MKTIKKILTKVLGYQDYLRLVSKMFFLLYNLKLLPTFKSFHVHYFVKKLIKPGYVVIDIGANVGYYSVIFSKLAGKSGKVYSVEPVDQFREILIKNTRKLNNITILPYALGLENTTVTMGIPVADISRHGLTRVLSDSEKSKPMSGKTFEVEMKRPQEVFGAIEKIDYIKCDIEGYEIPVIPAMKDIISKNMPIVQIETFGANRVEIYNFLKGLGYNCFYVLKTSLVEITDISQPTFGDLIFVPSQKMNEVKLFIK
jgi:FkbM family methyltransferase